MNRDDRCAIGRLRIPVLCVVAAVAAALCAPRIVVAQSNHTSILQASASKLLSIGSTPPASIDAAGTLDGKPLITRAGAAAELTTALAELFQAPVVLSRVSFSVDNALEGLYQHRAFRYVSPRLYAASRMYRVTCSVLEF